MERLADKYESNVRSADEKKLFSQRKTGRAHHQTGSRTGATIPGKPPSANEYVLVSRRGAQSVTRPAGHRQFQGHFPILGERRGAGISGKNG